MATIADYYRDPSVRQRMVEFLGGRSELSEASALFITASDHHRPRFDPLPVAQLWQCLDAGMDVARSLWDRAGLLAHLDLDYVNFTQPARAYLDRARAFRLQRPVMEAARELLAAYGIRPMRLLSGTGHHFHWRIDAGSLAYARLVELGPLPASLRGRYTRPQPPCNEVVGIEMGRAFAGLGMVMEYLTHRLLAAAARRAEVPVEATAVEVGPGPGGAEIVAIDISEYGDALHVRFVRVPFSVYLKPQQRRSMTGGAAGPSPLLFSVPGEGLSEQEALEVMQDPVRASALAGQVSAVIPDFSRQTETLIEDYRQSALADFHAWFYSEQQHPSEAWSTTYDRAPLWDWPPCVRKALQRPNDLLVKPGRIRHVVRMLMSLGWHPRHIAGLLRSKYERNFGWGDYWYTHDATSRADFYTRIFAGLFMTGRDDLVDFNCRSTQEKGYCRGEECVHNLEVYRQALLARRAAHV